MRIHWAAGIRSYFLLLIFLVFIEVLKRSVTKKPTPKLVKPKLAMNAWTCDLVSSCEMGYANASYLSKALFKATVCDLSAPCRED